MLLQNIMLRQGYEMAMIYSSKFDPQVVIAGGGPAGVCAAIAAARNGARTLLIERYGFLGGTATNASVGPLAPFHFRDEQVIKGIAQEIIAHLISIGGSTGHLKIEKSFGSGSYMCWFDREIYKYALLELVQKSGVKILFHSIVSDAIIEGNNLKGVVVQNKSGRQIILADVIIDATGDGDVIAASGAEFQYGRGADHRTQPMTLLFDMAGVDTSALLTYIKDNLEEFEWWSMVIPSRPLPSEFRHDYFVAQGFLSLVKDGIQKGELYIGRNSILLLTGLWPGLVIFNSTRVIQRSGVDPEDLTEAEIEGRKQMMSLVAFVKKYIPGFKNARLNSSGVQIGVRESRRLLGEYILTGEDVQQGRKFGDVIARGYFPIDIHHPGGAEGYQKGGSTWEELVDSYDIPYRCLLPKKKENLLAAGRCISVTHEALGSTRSTGSCMALGQAAGTAAAIAVRQGILPRNVNITELQTILEAQGASLR